MNMSSCPANVRSVLHAHSYSTFRMISLLSLHDSDARAGHILQATYSAGVHIQGCMHAVKLQAKLRLTSQIMPVLCRQLALKYHPDKATFPAQKAAADALFKLIAQAYSVLSDADRRMAYDASMLRAKYRTRFGSSFSRPSF